MPYSIIFILFSQLEKMNKNSSFKKSFKTYKNSKMSKPAFFVFMAQFVHSASFSHPKNEL